jgi:type II secretory ATPase GspE/PulE/Tfp pilus assembly ATPase PilB-like protein
MTEQRDPDISLPLDVDNLRPPEVVDRLLEHAANLTASDLFFCTNEHHMAVSARHLGVLRLVSALPLEVGRHCLAHMKTMAELAATERRRPLDGRWVHERPNGTVLDLRIETLPTLHGEDLAVRLLDRHSPLLALGSLGLGPGDHQQLCKLLRGGGLVLVTGPTGSGKTTTLYACLTYLDNGERKINTIEDPIEYALPGIRQSQVSPAVGLDFPDLLRAVLRQGPDVIMVGEVRDPVTAQTAVRAANSGHLVLATLHAPAAAGAVQSMLSLGVHPHYLASSLRAVVAQRLVRTLCPVCKRPVEPEESPALFDEVGPWLAPAQGPVRYRESGCPACRFTGYGGRTGVFELLTVSPPIRGLIAGGQPTLAIYDAAVREGMLGLRRAALLKVAAGETSLEEALRVVPADDLSEA